MADKILNITNNGTGTLTLGGVTIGNSSIATYNSSNKKISIVGAGTTNAAFNLNYIKGSVSKNFNRNFNILGKEDANTTFRNKVKALMEEYKYAVVSGVLYLNNTSNILMVANSSYIGNSPYSSVYSGYSHDDRSGADSKYCEVTSHTYTATSYTNKEVNIILDSSTNIMVRYKFSISFSASSSPNIYASLIYVSGDWDHMRYETLVSNQAVLSNANTVTCDYYIDFYYPGSGKTYSFTKNATKYPLKDLYAIYINAGDNTNNYVYADITSYSIQNLYGTVLTDRILNTLYS